MKLNVVKRTYIDDNTISHLEGLFPNLQATAEIGRQKSANMTFLPTIASNVSEDVGPRALDLIARLKSDGWKVPKDTTKTASEKFMYLFEQPSAPESVFTIMCVDQFPLHEERHWGPVIDLGERLLAEGNVYATGSRNVEVTLAVHRENSERRIIHEMIHTLAGGGPQTFGTEFNLEGTPHHAYEMFGESTSGLYIINPDGKGYSQIKREIALPEAILKSSGFVLEYLVSILAGSIDSVSVGSVYAETNPFYQSPSLEDEREKVQGFISREVTKLGRTGARNFIYGVCTDSERTAPLYRVFDKELVNEVVGITRRALDSSR
ncbi:hypothetical protein J4416_03800 [Candidatus Pacearchaeota archaeon]|nr:hypothetical protein [Candidatus Pacearchaeota archaeon]